MGASSVTGVSGPGDSKGKFKPDNNCGCGCGCKKGDCLPPAPPVKIGCYVSLKTGGSVYHKTGGSTRIGVCT